MRAGDDRSALVQQVLDGGQSGHDPLVAGDLAGLLVLGNVEVTAQQDLFALNVDVANGLLVVIHNSDSYPMISGCADWFSSFRIRWMIRLWAGRISQGVSQQVK